MQITSELYQAHRELSQCSAAFLEFAAQEPACLKRSGFDTLLSDKRFTYFKSQPWPTFINQKKKQEMGQKKASSSKLKNRKGISTCKLTKMHPISWEHYQK
ncbi:MAG: hypothetical protein MUF15_17845 [Acidobacteria bacterium]|nr:hypothetical protein [Acidobacteriota bacterium]